MLLKDQILTADIYNGKYGNDFKLNFIYSPEEKRRHLLKQIDRLNVDKCQTEMQ